MIPIGGSGLMGGTRNLYLLPSSPLDELRKQLPHAQIEFDPGISPAEAVLAARRADVAIVFAIRVEGEGADSADLSLPWGQDAVIAAVAAANPNTVVVLRDRQSGGHALAGLGECHPGRRGIRARPAGRPSRKSLPAR